MRKPFTLSDLNFYDQELALLDEKPEKAGPSKKALNNIMNYSRALAIIKTRWAGSYELLLN